MKAVILEGVKNFIAQMWYENQKRATISDKLKHKLLI